MTTGAVHERIDSLAGTVAVPGSKGRLGVIANGGQIPINVARAAQKQGYDVFVAGIKEFADKGIEQFPHAYVHLGHLGRLIATLKRENCRKIVIIGSLTRPNLWAQKFDRGFFLNLPRLIRMVKGGDDSVMRKVAAFFEVHGFEVLAAHEVAPELLAPEGQLASVAPKPEAMDDIRFGFRVVRTLGALDVGQAAAVSRSLVLAVEAAEGTDAMIRRCAGLGSGRKGKKLGVLVKAPKPGQYLRLDMPTIGPRTVELAAEAGLEGIAVAAGSVLIAELGKVVEKADELGLFLYGAPVSMVEEAG
jgi:DUF1009 family protein